MIAVLALLCATDSPDLAAKQRAKDVAGVLAPGHRVISQLNADVSSEAGVERVVLVGAVGEAGHVAAVGLLVVAPVKDGVSVVAAGLLDTNDAYAVTLAQANLDLDGDGVVEIAVEATAGEGARGIAETTWYRLESADHEPAGRPSSRKVSALYTLVRRRTVMGQTETRRLVRVGGRLREEVERKGAPPRSLDVLATPTGFRVVDWHE